MALVATAGASNADSYVTLDEALSYFENKRINISDYLEASDETGGTHEQLLRQACLILEQFDYIGDRATTTQALSWPRVINDFYELNHDEFPYTSTEIPVKIKYAQCEVALWLAQTGGTVSAGTVSELQIGSSVRAKFATGSETTSSATDHTGIPLEAARFLKGLRLYSVLA